MISNFKTDQPLDATARYRDYNGRTAWLKDLDERNPTYPMARLWSDAQGKWRLKREAVRLDRVLPLIEV